jgi:F0F1-type ATP synthase alpha subunit
LVQKQLFTGHARLDLAQPLSQGNFIIFKGERNLGKTSLAINTISQFLLENGNNRAIYVGLSKNNTKKGFESLSPEQKDRACFFSVGGEDTTISNAEYFLIPKIALQTAQSFMNDTSIKGKRNLLFVFDDILLHYFKERSIFDLANQPFAPFNIYNEIMENTGVFLDQDCSMTSIILVDKDSTSLTFKKDELSVLQHLESISD